MLNILTEGMNLFITILMKTIDVFVIALNLGHFSLLINFLLYYPRIFYSL